MKASCLRLKWQLKLGIHILGWDTTAWVHLQPLTISTFRYLLISDQLEMTTTSSMLIFGLFNLLSSVLAVFIILTFL